MTPISELHSRIEQQKALLGCCIDSANASNGELAAMIGYHLVWGELEHGSVSRHEAELFCQAVKAGGGSALLRIQSAERVHVLGALEAGASVVVVPMVDSPETARQIVQHGKYAPMGNRGFNGSSRGMRYGIGTAVANMEWANRETHLMVQIETVEALRRCREIVSVDGITGGVLGPGDLSVSLGKPLAFEDPEVVKAAVQVIREIRAAGKIAMSVTGHPTLLKATLEAGAQILVCAGERPSLKAHWSQNVKDVTAQIAR